ncbi:hypothetical protein PGT21_028479 [Puccinia graminis f. sp. tritici]|uniref:Uncharacterized protein n=1 Tax=Puccinia graminis f. sp. tritici TaxID=56615 RepID=A0A5B0LYU5_PUCGR|nr:hypothetical protein PGT21_028479 [Puccinia graminis f. sp. tritici]
MRCIAPIILMFFGRFIKVIQSSCNSPYLVLATSTTLCGHCHSREKVTNFMTCTSCRKGKVVYKACSTQGCHDNWHDVTCQNPKVDKEEIHTHCEICQMHTKVINIATCTRCRKSAETFPYCTSSECHARW